MPPRLYRNCLSAYMEIRYSLLALIFASLLLTPGWVLGAPDSSDTVQSPPEKYWIFLERSDSDASTESGQRQQSVAPHLLRRLRDQGLRPIVQSEWFHAISARLTPDEHAWVTRQSFVRRVRPVASGQYFVQSADLNPPLGASRAHLARINAVAPLQRGLTGRGVRVGFLDASFGGLDHPAFASLRADHRLAGLRDFTVPTQQGTHGYSVASVALGHAPETLMGPAHGATMLGATTEYTQFERNVEEDYFVAGLEWLTERGADVVNVSIGYTRFDEGEDSYAPSDLDGDTALPTRAVDRAAREGVTVVTSAGNNGCDEPKNCWYHVNAPADADSTITVGAVRPDSSLASFSSRGPTADGRIKPDVVVQGTRVVAAWKNGGYARVGGTSFASPQLTGIVAQMLQVNPELGPMDVRRLLRQTASQAQSPDTLRGWGVVDADAAIRGAERSARRSPPPDLSVRSIHHAPEQEQVTLTTDAPASTSALTVSLINPTGRRVHQSLHPAQPGPNCLTLAVSQYSPGVYWYRVTGPGHQASGTLSIRP